MHIDKTIFCEIKNVDNRHTDIYLSILELCKCGDSVCLHLFCLYTVRFDKHAPLNMVSSIQVELLVALHWRINYKCMQCKWVFISFMRYPSLQTMILINFPFHNRRVGTIFSYFPSLFWGKIGASVCALLSLWYLIDNRLLSFSTGWTLDTIQLRLNPLLSFQSRFQFDQWSRKYDQSIFNVLLVAISSRRIQAEWTNCEGIVAEISRCKSV